MEKNGNNTIHNQKIKKMAKHKSRATRFAEALEKIGQAKSLVEDARSEMETLKEELESWKDNLPENLQSSSKADSLDSAIGELEDHISKVEDLENEIGECEDLSVDFPGMMG